MPVGSTDADDGVKPAGLLHGVTPITATAGGGTAALAGDHENSCLGETD
jgi:hypothetical protein